MKRIVAIISVIIISAITLILGFVNKSSATPNTYYKVYINDEYLGMIENDISLKKYVDSMENDIKNQYGVNQVYTPIDYRAEKVVTYDKNIISIEDMYKLIQEKSNFSVKGYEFKIIDEAKNIVIYVLDENVFKDAIEKVIITFVGEEQYLKYKDENQNEIINTGIRYDNIYVQGNISYKNIYIPVNKKIYTSSDELAGYLLYSDNKEESTYVVKNGDTIASISYANEISPDEFLLSNPKFSNSQNLLYPGEKVSIVKLNPQIRVVVEEYIVSDMEKLFATEEKFDPNRYKGDNEVVQKGENGLERVSQNVKIVNGITIDVVAVSKTELRPSVNEIIVKGDKIIPNVGSLYSWLWPTDSGYRLTSYFGYRIDPVYGGRENHSGIDIAGLGYGKNIYASNNGTIETMTYDPNGYGNYIIINHNNGYWSLYGHMQKFASNIKPGMTVSRGQIIGYIGSTGKSTGAHLHYEVRKGCKNCRVDPLDYY